MIVFTVDEQIHMNEQIHQYSVKLKGPPRTTRIPPAGQSLPIGLRILRIFVSDKVPGFEPGRGPGFGPGQEPVYELGLGPVHKLHYQPSSGHCFDRDSSRGLSPLG